MNEVVNLARSSKDVLRILIKLIKDKNRKVRIGALTVLKEVLSTAGELEKLFIMKEGFEAIIDAIQDKDDVVSINAIKTLSALVKDFPLREKEFMKIIDTLLRLLKSARKDIALLELPEVLMNMRLLHPSSKVISKIMPLIFSKDPKIKAMGLMLLRNMAVSTGDYKALLILIRESRELLNSEDVLLIDSLLTIIMELTRLPVTKETVEEFSRTLTIVKNLALHHKESIIRYKAKTVAEAIEDLLRRYYESRPEEAIQRINELLKNERFEEAIDLALAIGDKYILKWLAEELEKMEKKRLQINGRIIPRPVYKSLSPEKLSSRTIRPLLLKDFKSPRKPSASTAEKFSIESEENRSPEETRTYEKVELPEVLESVRDELIHIISLGESEKLCRFVKVRREAVIELITMLKSEKIEERMDALWALYILSRDLKPNDLHLLKPAIKPLLDIMNSPNRWAKDRAAKTLANIALRSEFGEEILEEMLEWLRSPEKNCNIGALVFFSYYFFQKWDENVGVKVLDSLEVFLKDRETRFDALLTLEGIVQTIPKEKAYLLKKFVPILKELKNSESPEIHRISVRILDSMAEKDHSLVME
ncbi:hypothetical protein E3E31_03120 [Thermococcus sp. M39]|uniref:hypothetical protein n=1 Tax=unclassified Thermococcus TaxID=2627626 RepID=UPI00143A1DA7|nr:MULTISPECIES: hypothetical protein [unclassified Thermococcus]NJE07524.1 hypothetical protein [Thermococcus sp. M39]NJE12104.1 hypothetical protein [Thermococcus sp. LS2]